MPQSSVKPTSPRFVAKGVTLLEVMVVVAIIGIIAAIATPNFGPMLRSQKLQAKAEEVASLLDRARRDAYSRGRCVKIELDGTKLVAKRKSGEGAANCYSGGTEPSALDGPGAALAYDNWGDPLPLPIEAEGLTLTVNMRAGGDPLKNYIILRPSGRVRGDAGLETSDDAAHLLVYDDAIGRGVQVRVTSLGRVCKVAYSGTAPSLPADGVAAADQLECP